MLQSRRRANRPGSAVGDIAKWRSAARPLRDRQVPQVRDHTYRVRSKEMARNFLQF